MANVVFADLYVDALRRMVPHVHYLDPLEDCPDACFVEDPVSVVGNKAVMLPMSHVNRYPEVDKFAGQLAASGLGLDVDTSIKTHAEAAALAESSPVFRDGPTEHAAGVSPAATIDGGDVMWTGQELVIGLSSRTTWLGALALSEAHNCPAIVLRVQELQRLQASDSLGVLHLKSLVSMLSPSRLVSWGGKIGTYLTRVINHVRLSRLAVAHGGKLGADGPVSGALRPIRCVFVSAERGAALAESAGITAPQTIAHDAPMLLDPVSTSTALAANVVSANGFVLRQEVMLSADADAIDQAAAFDSHQVLTADMSELAKVDGALTCCSVLLPRCKALAK